MNLQPDTIRRIRVILLPGDEAHPVELSIYFLAYFRVPPPPVQNALNYDATSRTYQDIKIFPAFCN